MFNKCESSKSRRNFIKLSAATLGAFAAPAIISSRGVASEPEPVKVIEELKKRIE